MGRVLLTVRGGARSVASQRLAADGLSSLKAMGLGMLILSLLPILVLFAMAARMSYDDWRYARDARRQAERAATLRYTGRPRFTVLEGGASKPSSPGGQRPDKSA